MKAATGRCCRSALLALAAAAPFVQADPMRPLGAAPAQAAASAAVGEAASGAAAAPQGPRLVAIRQNSAQRWQALIGDSWLAVGDRFENQTVRDIDANTVQLGDGRARRSLQLLPNLSPQKAETPATLQAGTAASSSNRAEAQRKQ